MISSLAHQMHDQQSCQQGNITGIPQVSGKVACNADQHVCKQLMYVSTDGGYKAYKSVAYRLDHTFSTLLSAKVVLNASRIVPWLHNLSSNTMKLMVV